MSSRFSSNLHQRDSRSSLFSTYDARASSQSPSLSQNPSSRPSSTRPTYGYTSDPYSTSSTDNFSSQTGGGAFAAYPGANGSSGYGVGGGGSGDVGGFRSATPNSKGQYSDAVLSELESQNDEQVGVLTGKVRMLKDLTGAIGKEIRDSTALAEKMNDQFEGTRGKLQGTMKRMLRMAEKTGVGWKVWLGFFAAVIFVFWYVWLF